MKNHQVPTTVNFPYKTSIFHKHTTHLLSHTQHIDEFKFSQNSVNVLPVRFTGGPLSFRSSHLFASVLNDPMESYGISRSPIIRPSSSAFLTGYSTIFIIYLFVWTLLGRMVVWTKSIRFTDWSSVGRHDQHRLTAEVTKTLKPLYIAEL